MDKWIVSKLHRLIVDVTASMDGYDTALTCRLLVSFITDLSTWYLRRSRDRIQTDETGQQVFGWVLSHLIRLMAPITPFITERIYQNMETTGNSIHLAEWPVADQSAIDTTLDAHMAFVRLVAELGNAKRKELGIPVRQPLNKITVSTAYPALDHEWLSVFLQELNIKTCEIVKTDKETSVELDTTITPELKAEGDARKLIREIQVLRKEKGCKIDEYVSLVLPKSYTSLEALLPQIKQATLASTITWGDQLSIDTHKTNTT